MIGSKVAKGRRNDEIKILISVQSRREGKKLRSVVLCYLETHEYMNQHNQGIQPKKTRSTKRHGKHGTQKERTNNIGGAYAERPCPV